MKKCYSIFFAVLLSAAAGSAQTVSTIVTGSTFNDGVALDTDGNIYAAEYFGDKITRITPEGMDSVWATGLNSPNGIAFGPDGNLYVPNFGDDNIISIAPDGMQTEFVDIADPGAILFNDDGSMLVADYQSNIVSHIDTAGTITELVSGSPLNGPIGLVRDESGTLYIGNFTDGEVYRFVEEDSLELIGDLPGNLGFMTMADNVIFATAYLNHQIYMVPLDGSGEVVFAGTGLRGGVDGPVETATFDNPNGIIATSTGDTLYVSEWARSMRMITGVLKVTSVGPEPGLVREFHLSQNYPNPFNPSTEITYSIGSRQSIALRIFNVLGQEVASLVNETRDPGRYTVTWDASGQPSGVYYYRLEAGNFVETKKLMLLK